MRQTKEIKYASLKLEGVLETGEKCSSFAKPVRCTVRQYVSQRRDGDARVREKRAADTRVDTANVSFSRD